MFCFYSIKCVFFFSSTWVLVSCLHIIMWAFIYLLSLFLSLSRPYDILGRYFFFYVRLVVVVFMSFTLCLFISIYITILTSLFRSFCFYKIYLPFAFVVFPIFYSLSHRHHHPITMGPPYSPNPNKYLTCTCCLSIPIYVLSFLLLLVLLLLILSKA